MNKPVKNSVRLSNYFMPTYKDNPKEAEIVSHRYMLRAGMIQQTSAGIYAWLPTGLRVLNKIADIVRAEQNASGAHEVLMPTIQSADLWRQSGRYDDYGKEMLRITDRGDRDMLYGPTNEEMITDIFKSHVGSYKQLPRNLYHIQWKFRDEVRPRFGIMRGREFLMKDAYSFDLNKEDAQYAYHKMFLSYFRIFAKLGVQAIPMKADTGPIGGDMSHEFIVLADTGESEVFADKKWFKTDMTAKGLEYNDREGLSNFYKEMSGIYAATDEIHKPEDAEGVDLKTARGIEVGHIFYFGTKYSEPLGATVQDNEGNQITLHMGSYGIGVSRLVGGIIEASHDDNGIIWPESVSPFDIGLINLKISDDSCNEVCEKIFNELDAAGKEVLYDDRDEGAGKKFNDMDLIGLPWQVTIGPKGVKNGMAELKNRKTGEKSELPIDSVVEKLS